MDFEPKCLATGIGSFPHLDAASACELILKTTPEIPFWPQLPRADYREQMEIQYSEGMPCIVLDQAKERMYFDTSGDPTPALGEFYEQVIAENLDHFKISPDFSRGLSALVQILDERKPPSIQFLKSQVTGPVTFGLAIVDENKRASFYNDVFRDVVAKAITQKARWILQTFAPLGHKQICFVDEPILSAFGSSTYVSVQKDDVVSLMREVIDEVHAQGALVGTHCCGNTEWPLLVEAGVDIISFDAYEFGETIGYYPEPIGRFLEAGGAIAWGIVPTSQNILQETPDSLAGRLEAEIRNLASKGIDDGLIRDRCLLTPSCGTGSMPVELSERVFVTLAGLSRTLRG